MPEIPNERDIIAVCQADAVEIDTYCEAWRDHQDRSRVAILRFSQPENEVALAKALAICPEGADISACLVFANSLLGAMNLGPRRAAPLKAEPSKAERRRDTRQRIAHALLTRAEHPDWTDRAIAKTVGLNPSQLTRSSLYQNARAKASAAAQRGHRNVIWEGGKKSVRVDGVDEGAKDRRHPGQERDS